MARDLYDILGVDKKAGPKQLKSAYRRRVMKNHPDRGGNEEEVKLVQLAYDVLKDPGKRERYDKYGETDPQESIKRLGDFAKQCINPQHEDYLLEPLKELRTLTKGFDFEIVALNARLEKVQADIKGLQANGHAEEVEDVIVALSQLENGFEQILAARKASSAQCNMLIEQYTRATDMLDRDPDKQKPRPFWEPPDVPGLAGFTITLGD